MNSEHYISILNKIILQMTDQNTLIEYPVFVKAYLDQCSLIQSHY